MAKLLPILVRIFHIAIFTVLASGCLHAQSFTTYSQVNSQGIDGSVTGSNDGGAVHPISGNSQTAFSTSSTLGGVTLQASGSAAAQRGSLHSSSSYTILGSGALFPDPNITQWGIGSISSYEEYGVHAVNTGPTDLLPNITAYKVTFDLDGTINPIGYNGDSALLIARPEQGSYAANTTASFYSDPLGPVSFYIQPPDLTGSFNIVFYLETFAEAFASVPYGIPDAADVDFFNTATLDSIQAVDANGNVISGVDLLASDGFNLTDIQTTPATTPEPSSLWLVSIAAPLAEWARRRKGRRVAHP